MEEKSNIKCKKSNITQKENNFDPLISNLNIHKILEDIKKMNK
jgi:hypothetical protein